jgi:hypothetical protein
MPLRALYSIAADKLKFWQQLDFDLSFVVYAERHGTPSLRLRDDRPIRLQLRDDGFDETISGAKVRSLDHSIHLRHLLEQGVEVGLRERGHDPLADLRPRATIAIQHLGHITRGDLTEASQAPMRYV